MTTPQSLHARPWVRICGQPRGQAVRFLYAEGCSVTEIAAYLRTQREKVRRTLRRKVGQGTAP